ncbi:hypothetical protein TSUD_138730 [Trifolium subterraneum]|uniref:Uncharacterized protein n=1 Tax=Trifolium subterraneum TaxID=3900 RepID=A0A2Z6P1I9_TRISU|nr:hypothetical protein TSUD_138730 [Trifolium subterraneum]
MISYELLPHEYSYALYLSYEYDLHPYDSMILNMVSERYPRDEVEDYASAYGSKNCEENQVQEDDSSSDFASMENKDPEIVFGNFHEEPNLEKAHTLSINPSIEGNSIEIGSITCFINPVISQSTVPAFSSPIKVEHQYGGNVQFSQDHDHNSNKGETFSDFLLFSSESITFFSYYRDYGIIVFDPGGALFTLPCYAVYKISFGLLWMPWDRGRKPFDIDSLRCFLSMITEKHNLEKIIGGSGESDWFCTGDQDPSCLIPNASGPPPNCSKIVLNADLQRNIVKQASSLAKESFQKQIN